MKGGQTGRFACHRALKSFFITNFYLVTLFFPNRLLLRVSGGQAIQET